jgi:nucleoside-diphosphate-sugar epimerase
MLMPLPRVLILGAGGFLSPVLRRHLEAHGANVIAMGRAALDLTAPDAGPRLAEQIGSRDVLVMAAALTPDKGKNAATLMANLRMGEAVSRALDQARPAQFVYISSDGVYDARFSSLLNEESTCEPADFYSLMHVGRERILAQSCQQAGIPFLVVRPCAIYGPGDTHNSYGPNRFIRSALEDGKITLFGNGEERRHHVLVDDLSELIRLCIAHETAGVLNGVTGSAVSFGELAEKICRLSARKIVIEKWPRVSSVTHRHFDTSALARAFPAFRATSLDDGLQKMLAPLSAANSATPKQETELCPK